MALLGSFVDSRKLTWDINRKSYSFRHGLPEKPSQVIICPLSLYKGKGYIYCVYIDSKVVKIERYKKNNKKYKVKGVYSIVSILDNKICR